MHSTLQRHAPLLVIVVATCAAGQAPAAVVLNSAVRSTFVSVSNSPIEDVSLERAGPGAFGTAFGRTGANSAATGEQGTNLMAALGTLSFTGPGITSNSANGGTANAPIAVRGDVNCSLNFSVVGQSDLAVNRIDQIYLGHVEAFGAA